MISGQGRVGSGFVVVVVVVIVVTYQAGVRRSLRCE